jgi:hypothetical protein
LPVHNLTRWGLFLLFSFFCFYAFLSSFAHIKPTKLLGDALNEETSSKKLVSCNVKIQLLETSATNRDMRA